MDADPDADPDAEPDAEPEDAAEGDFGAEADGVRPGFAGSLGLSLPLGGILRPGRGRPSPACRPASDAEALGFFAVGVGRGDLDSSAYAGGTASSRNDATVVTHTVVTQCVRSLGVTG